MYDGLIQKNHMIQKSYTLLFDTIVRPMKQLYNNSFAFQAMTIIYNTFNTFITSLAHIKFYILYQRIKPCVIDADDLVLFYIGYH